MFISPLYSIQFLATDITNEEKFRAAVNVTRNIPKNEWHTPDIVLIQLNLLMMSTWMLETC